MHSVHIHHNTPGLLDRMQELLVETVQSRFESNQTLHLLFDVCNAQRASIARMEKSVENIQQHMSSYTTAVNMVNEDYDM